MAVMVPRPELVSTDTEGTGVLPKLSYTLPLIRICAFALKQKISRLMVNINEKTSNFYDFQCIWTTKQ